MVCTTSGAGTGRAAKAGGTGSGRRCCCLNSPGRVEKDTRYTSVSGLLVDIPSRWEPHTEQQPTGLIAHPTLWVGPCCSNPPGRVKKDTRYTDVSSLLVDIPSRWKPRTNKSPTGAFVAPPTVGPCCSNPPGRVKKTPNAQVCIGCLWCDREDSNLWPSGSEPNALSS